MVYEFTSVLPALRSRVSQMTIYREIQWQNKTDHRWMEEGSFSL